MSKRNYTNYAKKYAEKSVEPEVVETADVELTEADPVETEPVAPTPVYGIVSGCNSLNIRKEPNRNAEVLCVETIKAIVAVDLDKSTDEWDAVCTKDGVDGFCMKQYITLGK